ncbi:MAG: leucine-rich repeat domain-containing protein [Muribaculaceae bacterium]|nr:leucine-rich repeat domain-containing protein [Muribaculaceae bacterium]
MHSFLRISILLLSILIGIQVFAENFEDKTINNITYTYISGKNNIKAHAKVISGKNASGNITLPNEVEFHKKEWNKDKGIYDDVYATVPVCVIGSRSFSKNVNIQSVTANYIDSIESSAFEGCTSLVQVKAGNTLKKIKDRAFSGCTALKSINLPNPGLISIGDAAFKDCKLLYANSTLKIPQSVTSVGAHAFSGCGAKEVAWNAPIAIPDRAFSGCENLASISLGNTNGIGAYAFCGCKSLNSIGTIPRSCTSIGDYAFSSCTSLLSFTLSNGLTDIGEYAFSGTAITSLNFPEGCNNLTIHANAFYECWALKHISSLNSKNIIIEKEAFSGLRQLETILFSEGIVKIGANNFSDCPLLKDFELPNTIEQIGDYDIHKNGYKEILYGCFNNCPLLTKIDLPANVADKTIELYYSFCECETLNKASKAPNQNYIDDKCFQRCPMLGAVTTRKPSQSNVTSRASRSNAKSIIRNGSFDDCENLEHFDCEFTLEEGGGFMWCNKLKFDTYHIPYNEIVPSRATPSCFVKHVTMPMSVRQLNRSAITKAGTISIPDSLRVIQKWALGVY